MQKSAEIVAVDGRCVYQCRWSRTEPEISSVAAASLSVCVTGRHSPHVAPLSASVHGARWFAITCVFCALSGSRTLDNTPLEMPLSQLGAIDAPQNTQEGDQEKGNRGETTDKAKAMQEKTDKQTTALVRVQLWRTRGCGAVTFNMFAQPLQLSEIQLQSAWLAVSPHSP